MQNGGKVMKSYAKKPLVVQAEQFDGTETHAQKLRKLSPRDIVEWEEYEGGPLFGCIQIFYLRIRTPEGTMELRKGDWLIKGIEGEFYPCKDLIFRASYDEVESIKWS